jgi:hypothetical protein
MKHVFSITLFAVITLSIAGCSECREDSRTEVITIPRDDWFPQIERILNSSTIRLNNFRPDRNEFAEQEFAFFRENDSHFTIDGMRFPVNELNNRANFRREPYTVYINDINSRSASTSISQLQLVTQLQFESEGTEVISDCIENIICFEKPRVEINNAVVNLRLSPRVDNTGNISFQGTAQFSANTQVSLCNNNFFAFLCDLLGINEGAINQQIENGLAQAINSPEIQGRISGPLMAHISPRINAGERLTAVILLNTGELMITKAVPCR